MIKKLINSLLIFILLILNITVYAYGNTSNTATIQRSGDKKYKAVRLIPEIYNRANDHLSDIRIVDEKNEVVPYFINSFVKETTITQKTYPLKLINTFVKDEYYYMDYTLETPLEVDVIATSINVLTQANGFSKKVQLLGSYDNTYWEKITDDYIYSVEGNEKLQIMLNASKYTHYRFKILNNLEKIAFDSATLNYDSVTDNKKYFLDEMTPEFSVKEEDKTTIVTIKNIKNIKLDSIDIQSDTMFNREVIFDHSVSKTLYNLEFEETSLKDTTLPLEAYKVIADTVELQIKNLDNKPIQILGIKVKYYVDEVVFDGSTSLNYTLIFGDQEATALHFDIENYKQHIIQQGYDTLDIKELSIQTLEKSLEEKFDYKIIFNIMVVVISILLGVFILSKFKDTKS